MATESSAIARFVNQVQSHAIDDPYAQNGFVGSTQPVPPPMSGPLPPPPHPLIVHRARRGRSSGLWLAVVGIVVIGGAIAGGYVLAQQEVQQVAAPADTIGAKMGSTASSAIPSQASLDGMNAAVPSEAALGAGDADEDIIEPDTDPSLAAAEPGAMNAELAEQTGFDILVEPGGATISLDGNKIGLASLRVRRLVPGVHSIDIEGPEGYFGKHLEFVLAAGEAQVFEIDLVAIDDKDSANTDRSAKVKEAAKSGDQKPEPSQRQKTAANKKTKDTRTAKRQTPSEGRSAATSKAIASASRVNLGTLMLGAKPPCDIFIDGKNTGLTTPQRSIQLPEGTHRVVLVNEQHGIKKAFRVNIKAGRTTRAIQDLSKSL